VPAASSRPPYWAAPNSTFRRFRRFAQARPSGRAACHRCTCCGVARRGREDGRALTAATAREAGGCRCEPREEHVPAFLPTKAPPVSVWIEPEASPSIMCPCFSTLVFRSHFVGLVGAQLDRSVAFVWEESREKSMTDWPTGGPRGPQSGCRHAGPPRQRPCDGGPRRRFARLEALLEAQGDELHGLRKQVHEGLLDQPPPHSARSSSATARSAPRATAARRTRRAIARRTRCGGAPRPCRTSAATKRARTALTATR
jgi:hypothetical protein